MILFKLKFNIKNKNELSFGTLNININSNFEHSFLEL